MKIKINKKLFLHNFPLIIAIISISLVFVFLTKEIKETKSFINKSTNIYFLHDLSFYQKETPFLILLWDEIKQKMISYGNNFIEVDLDKKKTRIYENGEIKDEFPIQAIGNPLNWGGTPVGIYNVLEKHSSAFSNSVEAHMPYAVQFYGKYFLHGQPYYRGGIPITSFYSGGCVRYSNANAKKIFDFVNNDVSILVTDKKRDNYEYPETNPDSYPEVSAESFIVADLDSGTVLLERNLNKKMSIASITKLMTAIVVSENIGLNRSIFVTEKMINYYNDYGETPEIKTGIRYQLIELLYPLLVRSSNQSSEILASFLGKEKTVSMMNKKARNINMRNTSFNDTSGLSDKNISTSKDLFYLGRYLLNNFSPILSITKSEIVPKIEYLRFNLNELENRNIFIHDPDFVGGKTGFTNTSKNTALFIFELEDVNGKKRNIIITLLKSEGLKKDTQSIYAWLSKNYFNN